MSELPVPAVEPPEPPRPRTLVCANCHAELTGEFCAACGQRHEPHVHTLAHFAGEAFESISHADSRLWRTLWYLFARPGFLTREFFAGHRVAYLPPFRLYLVLSLLVFLFSSATSDDPALDRPVNRNPVAVSPPVNGRIDAPVDAPIDAEATAALAEAADAMNAAGIQAEAEKDGYRLRIQGLDEFCEPFDKPETGSDGAAARRNIRQFCDTVRNDSSELFTALWHNLPRAMFIFLPLLAAIMKLMYWRPKRYYVEHLLFLLHNHAAVFLMILLLILFSFIPWLGDFTPLMVFVTLGYMAWYVYRGMRNFYGQHGGLTFLKYAVLGWTYVITAFFTLLLTLVALALLG
jgi:hypothetical protein